MSIHAQMTLQPDAVTHSACISACEKASQWSVALKLLSEAEHRDATMLASAVAACAGAAMWRWAHCLRTPIEIKL